MRPRSYHKLKAEEGSGHNSLDNFLPLPHILLLLSGCPIAPVNCEHRQVVHFSEHQFIFEYGYL